MTRNSTAKVCFCFIVVGNKKHDILILEVHITKLEPLNIIPKISGELTKVVEFSALLHLPYQVISTYRQDA
jgi:hypothetical protein